MPIAHGRPRCCSPRSSRWRVLILAVLGAILFGLATPTEAAAVGALGARPARRRLPGADLGAAARVGLSHRAHLGDGLLAVRRLGHLRLGLRLSRRPEADRGVRARPRPVRRCTFLILAQVDHLPARLAAGVDRDHHHLRADLPAAAATFRHRPAVLRHPGRAQPADRVPAPPMAMSAYYLKGIAPPHVDADPDLQRLHAVHGASCSSRWSWSTCSRGSPSGCRRCST